MWNWLENQTDWWLRTEFQKNTGWHIANQIRARAQNNVKLVMKLDLSYWGEMIGLCGWCLSVDATKRGWSDPVRPQPLMNWRPPPADAIAFSHWLKPQFIPPSISFDFFFSYSFLFIFFSLSLFFSLCVCVDGRHFYFCYQITPGLMCIFHYHRVVWHQSPFSVYRGKMCR